MSDDILHEVIRILKEDCLVEAEVTPESNIFADLELDSIGLITLLKSMESRFNITIDESQLTSAPETVGEIAEFAKVFLANGEFHHGTS